MPVLAAGLRSAELPAVIDRVAAAIDYLRATGIPRGRVGAGDVRVVRDDQTQQVRGIEFDLPETGAAPMTTPADDVHSLALFAQATAGGSGPELTGILAQAVAAPGQYPNSRALAGRIVGHLAPPATPVSPPVASTPAPASPPPASPPPPAAAVALPHVPSGPSTNQMAPPPGPHGPGPIHPGPPSSGTGFDPVPGQPGGPAAPRAKKTGLLIGIALGLVVVVVAGSIGVWALVRTPSENLDAAKDSSIWNQQISLDGCAVDDPKFRNPDATTVALDRFYRDALMPCFNRMWDNALDSAGTPLPPDGYSMLLIRGTGPAAATGQGCIGLLEPNADHLNCANGFVLRDRDERYSQLLVPYAYDVAASMYAYQVLITSKVVESVTASMKKVGSTSVEAAGFSRSLNAAAACLGGVMVKTHLGQGLTDADVAAIRNLATFGTVAADDRPAFDVSPGNYRYWRNYGIDQGKVSACKEPLANQEHVK